MSTKCHVRFAGLTTRRLNFTKLMQKSDKRDDKGLWFYRLKKRISKDYFLGRLVPYFERDWLRSLTPAQSKEPRTVW